MINKKRANGTAGGNQNNIEPNKYPQAFFFSNLSILI